MKLICPQCCADIRNTECDPCSYYRAAENYQAEKFQKSGERSFVIELDETFEKEVNIAGMVRAFRKVVRLAKPDELVYRKAKGMLLLLEQSVRKVNGTDLHTFIKAQDIFEIGIRLMENDEWEKAVEAYKKSLALNASTPQPFGNMGIYHAKRGEKEEAIEAFDRALGIDPDYELAIVNKTLTEALAPGEKLDAQMSIIEYYKDYKGKNRSYVEEFTKEMKDLVEKPSPKM